MKKYFIFRNYDNSSFWPLCVELDKINGKIYIDSIDVGNIVGLAYEDVKDFTINGDSLYFSPEGLLKMLKSKPERRFDTFRNWFEYQILPRILDEFNSFTLNDTLCEINDTLNQISGLLEWKKAYYSKR